MIQSIRKLAPSLTDADLVLAARTGEGWARETLFRRHVDALHGVTFRLLGPHGGARDVLETAFIEAFNSLRKLRDPAAFRPWASRIVVQCVRRRLSERRFLGLGPVCSRPDFAGFRSQLTLAAEGDRPAKLIAFYEAAEELGVDQRLTRSLRELEGLEVQDIAYAMGAPASTVRHWLLDAARRMPLLRPELVCASDLSIENRSSALPVPLSEFERAHTYRRVEAKLDGRKKRRTLPLLTALGVGVGVAGGVAIALKSTRAAAPVVTEVAAPPVTLSQSIELPDGSRASLGPSTELKIELVEPLRIKLSLLSGRADFDISGVDGRSFIVSVADAEVSALGRRLSVSVEPADGPEGEVSIFVRAVDGPADVYRRGGGPPIVLGPGESWSARSSRLAPEVEPPPEISP